MNKAKPVKLKIDWATHAAAKYACENWHYSKCMPINKIVKLGVWEDHNFVGVVLFSCGASSSLGKRYGLNKQQVCELTRVALTRHKTMVSKIISVAIKMLKRQCPGLRLIISFADPRQGHVGSVYQAGNWIYEGPCEPGGAYEYYIGGRWIHQRSAKEKYGYVGKKLIEDKKLKVRRPTNKHRYLMPLDSQFKIEMQKRAKPYPKRASSKGNVATVFQTVGGGAIPTDALQLEVANG